MFEPLVLVLSLQAAPQGYRPEPDAAEIVGTVELSPAAAFESARALAADRLVERVRDVGARVVEADKPFWLPDFVGARVLEGWVVAQTRGHEIEVLDRSERVRDHGFGPSYQTTLVVTGLRPAVDATRALSRMVREASRRFLAMCGATVALWSVLALAFWWLDRLSRGYMTARLLALAAAIGLILPGIAFVLA